MTFSFKAMATTIKSYPSKPTPTIFQTIGAALKLLQKSITLSLPLLLFSILASSLFFLSNYLSVAPAASNLLARVLPFLTNHPPPTIGPRELSDLLADTRRLAAAQLPFSLAALPLSLLLLIAAIHAFSSAYSDKPLTFLSLLKKINNRWYQTLITQLYIILLTVGFAVITSVAIGLVKLIWENSPTAEKSIGVLCMVSESLYVYLRTRWWMSLVITVVEKKETYGIGALSWAVELFVGNVRRGVMITVLDEAVGAAVAGAYVFSMAGAEKDLEMQIKISLVIVAASVAWKFFMVAIYTVYYYECRESFELGEQEEVEGFMYMCVADKGEVKRIVPLIV